MHGGVITVSSPGEGQGATFVVSLPIQVLLELPRNVLATTDESADSANQEFSLAGLRVLVVDDEAHARLLIQRGFATVDCHVDCVASVSKALFKLDQQPFDLIISDIGMPGQDGYALIRQWRQTESARQMPRTPAMALTAYARPEDRRRALLAGFNAHLAEPVDIMELVTVAASLTNRICGE